MIKLCGFIFLVILRSSFAQTEVTATPAPDIITGNHFRSQTSTARSYNITSLQPKITVSVVLNHPSSATQTTPITLTLSSGSSKKTCVFKNLKQLCVLDNPEKELGLLQLSCASKPCQVSWMIYQIPVHELKTSDKVEELYIIPKQFRRMHISFFCNDKEVTDPLKLTQVYSSFQIDSVAVQKNLVVSFSNSEPGHILLKKNPDFNSCLNIRVSKLSDKVSTQLQSDLIKTGKTAYPLSTFPDGLFRFDMQFDLGNSAQQRETSKNVISITGITNGERKAIRSIVITEPTLLQKTFNFNFAIPTLDKSVYSNLQLEIDTQDSHLFVEFQLATDDRILMQATEKSIFDLKKGQKLPIRLVKEEFAEKGDKAKIFLSDKNALTTTKKQCDLGPQCDFQIQAKEDIVGSLYIGGKQHQKEVLILDFKDAMKFTKKVTPYQATYIKKKLQLQKALQVTINSPNVMIYMATSKKGCGLPSQDCYDALGNIHKNFIFTPETAEDEEVIFLIEAFDNCEFTLTLLQEDTKYVELEDSQPFAYQLDREEQFLKFKFHRKIQADVSFNVVSALHAVELLADNTDDVEEGQISAEGFLSFPFEDYKKSEFTIMVRKRESHKKKNVHFVIIASTKGTQVRLQNSITHYETLPKKSGKTNSEYIFEFSQMDDYVLNFYCHNVKEQTLKISMIISTFSTKKLKDSSLTSEEKQKVKTFIIDKPYDRLDLSEVSKDLCEAEGESAFNCQVFLMLHNNMDIEIDIAITLMSRNSIIELKDGVWQGFDLSTIAKTAHFFFYPQSRSEDISLLYKTDQRKIRLKYRLFYGNQDNISPVTWPFPSPVITDAENKKFLEFRPTNQMIIGKEQLKACWPDCIVLISMVELNDDKKQEFQKASRFSLMASNSIMEIPEKQKIEVTMIEQQQKMFLVDLKYAIDQDKDIFFNVFHSIGLVNLYVNVYSERNERIPDEDEHDFMIKGHDEMKIQISKVKNILEQEQMDGHNNIYLYIVAQAVSNSKFSIQFAFNEQDEELIKLMAFDTFEHVKIEMHRSKIFYASIEQPFEIKVERTMGFPFYDTKSCKGELQKCLNQFKSSTSKGTQLLTKVATISQKPCSDCYQLFKIMAEQDPAEARIHLQSSYTQIELVQSKTIYDFAAEFETNRYVLYALRFEQTFINVDVSEGSVVVQITDFHKVNLKNQGSKILSFTIPPTKKQENEKADSDTGKQPLQKQVMDAYAYSDKFIEFQVTIKSTSKDPAIYTITYSSGQREFDLQDGLITKFLIEPKKQHVFYYSSKSTGHAYLAISMETANELKKLDISLKYCQPTNQIIDENCWMDYQTLRPPIKQKTPNPSIMYSLPAYNYIAVFLTNTGSTESTVSLGINHQQIMILPFDKQYPFVLHQAESINFLVELSNPGYVDVIVRKCDESTPVLKYTYDYDGFQNQEYLFEQALDQSPKTNFMSKVKPGTLYIHFQSPASSSLLSLYVHYSDKKIKDLDIRAGNNGDMTYSIVDSNNAELTFHPPVCSHAQCPKKTKIMLMVATKMKDLYTQLVCPSNFFSSLENFSIDPIKEQEVQPKTNADGSMSVQFAMSDQISYVGLKVISDPKSKSSAQEIYYRPIQVATLWGQLSRTSHSHKLAISTVFICSFLGVIVMVRRNARRGYKPIEDEI